MRAGILSFFYRTTRWVVTKTIYFFQAIFFKSRDLEPAVNFGDAQLSTYAIFGKLIYDFKIPLENSIEVFDLKFPSPLMAASFKSESEILIIWLRMGLGCVMFKTIMAEPRQGNPRPRLQDASISGEKGILNSMGIPGSGITQFSQELPNSTLWNFNRPLGISIGGDSSKEYVDNVEAIESVLAHLNHPYFYELNISCPNTENGLTIAEEPNKLENVIKKIRGITGKPISIKVSPDLSNDQLNQIGEICSSVEQSMINAGNTQYKRPTEVKVNPNHFSMEGGGFSGPALFDRTLEMVNLFSQFKMPIIATGGISTFAHIRSLKDSGASLFGMATALVLDPYCIPKINSEF